MTTQALRCYRNRSKRTRYSAPQIDQSDYGEWLPPADWKPTKKSMCQPPSAVVIPQIQPSSSTLLVISDDGAVDLTADNSIDASAVANEVEITKVKSPVAVWALGELVNTCFGWGSIQGIHGRKEENALEWESVVVNVEGGELEDVEIKRSQVQDKLYLSFSSSKKHLKPYDIIESINGDDVLDATVEEAKLRISTTTDKVVLKLSRSKALDQKGVCNYLAHGSSTTTESFMYEVWLQWGDGCYFTEFGEKEAEQVSKKKRRGKSFDTAWTSKVFLSADKVSVCTCSFCLC